MNQNRDALIDTTGTVIRIDEIKEVQLNRYRVCGYVGGVKRVIISEHKDLEEAKKVVDVIHLAAGLGMDAFDFNEDMSNLDEALTTLRTVTTRKMLKLIRDK
jgi:hypothetical protein